MNKLGLKEYVYYITDGHYTKIGKSSGDIRYRLRSLQTAQIGEIYPLGFSYALENLTALQVEKILHNRYVRYKVRGEWYDLCLSSGAPNSLPNDTVNIKTVMTYCID